MEEEKLNGSGFPLQKDTAELKQPVLNISKQFKILYNGVSGTDKNHF